MRKARSVAWFSTAGFHQRSKCTTCDAAVRFRPEPPALSESTKNGTVSSSWKVRTRSLRLFTAVSPCSTSPGRPNTPPRNVGQRRGHLAELGEDQHLLLPRRDDLGDLAQAGQLAAVLLGPGVVVAATARDGCRSA